jgi:signal transduction histidine kinase
VRTGLSQLCGGLRFRLFLLVVLVCAPLAAVVLHSAWDGRRAQVAEWRRHAQNMMYLAGREEEELIGQTRQLLLAVAESSAVRTDNRRACKKLLDELFASYPRYANLAVLGTNGEFLAAAVPQKSLGRADGRAVQRALQSGGLGIGDFPGEGGDGKATVSMSRPVFGADGRMQALVLATLDLDWVNRFETELRSQLPNGATWTEVNRDGIILARYPAPGVWTGRPLPEAGLLKSVLGQPEGVVEALDARGVLNFYAYATRRSQLAAGEVIAILGIPQQELFAGVDRLMIHNLLGLGVAGGVALLLGWVGSHFLILRQVRALAASSARLAAGDLTARTGLPPGRGELGELTRTFDRMAQALEAHEAERERANQKLQLLSRRLVTAQENERRHIARELHDQIGQALTVAQMNLQAALQSGKQSDRSARLKECLGVVESTLAQVHDLSLNLRPSMLDDLGLVPALRWLTERQASLAGLRCELRADALSNHLDPVVKTECFRVAQEALTNVVRHARARAVTVELRQADDLLHLWVRDDGVGFEVATVREQAVRGVSLGVLSMEERAALAGGGLEMKSEPGQGTEVHAWFPTRRPVPKPFAETDV